ncbi:hypothetical protein GCM10012320_34960 [Sinomonas cellulolyticus]|uniref:DUF4258 domain-containing protein n=1 Tax=Sinomonas cellulolyticus TaxID=2801916 RepID=A0ABS1K4L1_9MICC|nr:MULTISPECIES: DUF4258 domain-containing protein [Sinomonas]MBL0706624.1 DUF4258 domain-containing protein [Sinomonas cellulolyticus]GHG60384.1 hypothetical protein GCM10012320_34960 [Sinomonas sp. KCTC 49339]
MELEISRHAQRRMDERGITKAEVNEALENVEMSMPGDSAPVCYIGRTRDGLRLKICLSGTIEQGAEGVTLKLVTVHAY